MVVAHVLTSLAIGGGERVALELAAGQVAAGHEVMVVSLAPAPDGPLANQFAARGVAVHRVAKRPGFDPTLPVRLALFFRAHRVGVVHLHNRLPLIYGAAPGRVAGAVVVHTRHGPRPGTSRQRWLERGAARFLHAYVAVTPDVRQTVAALGDCPEAKLEVIENGIDVARFDLGAEDRLRARQDLGIPASAWVAGSVGRMAVEKEFPLLVRAAAPLLGPDARLLIVGDGAELPAVRAAAAAAGVAAFVHLPGSRDDVPRCLAAMDAFVLSSRFEGMPLAVLEAMATGLPVVATAVGGLPGLIRDQQTGFLVPSGDEHALRDRLSMLRADPERGRAVGARGREQARAHHGREAMLKRYLDLYGRTGRAGR